MTRGIGVIGSSLTMALPLDALGLADGGRITSVTVRAGTAAAVSTASDTLTLVGAQP